MKIKNYCLSIMLLTLFLANCSNRITKDPILTDPIYTNQQINLHFFDFNNSYKNSDPISGEIWNDSQQVIKFPNNFNIRIFEQTKKGWVEIYEKPVTELPTKDFVLNPSNSEMLFVIPNIQDKNKKHDLRIYVFGQLEEDGKDIEVSAYKDITLTP
jgi:hypothetical protein